MSSLITYACAYAVIFGAGIWYLLKMIRRAQHPDETPPEHGGGQTAARPLSVDDDASGGDAAGAHGSAWCRAHSCCLGSGTAGADSAVCRSLGERLGENGVRTGDTRR